MVFVAFLLRSYLWVPDVYVLCTLVFLFFCYLCIHIFPCFKKKDYLFYELDSFP